MPISSRDPSMLPAPTELRRLMQSLAVLDAILCRVWQNRYYSFNSRFAPLQQLGSMRNGEGDDFHAVFTNAGCFLKGFHHESKMSPYRAKPHRPWPGLFDGVPPAFAPQLEQAAFDIEDTTFCLWRLETDSQWRRGPVEYPPGDDPDGSARLLSILDGDPQTYCQYAADYFEKPHVPAEAVRLVYDHEPLTDEMVAALTNTSHHKRPRRVAPLAKDLTEIGYPH